MPDGKIRAVRAIMLLCYYMFKLYRPSHLIPQSVFIDLRFI